MVAYGTMALEIFLGTKVWIGGGHRVLKLGYHVGDVQDKTVLERPEAKKNQMGEATTATLFQAEVENK